MITTSQTKENSVYITYGHGAGRAWAHIEDAQGNLLHEEASAEIPFGENDDPYYDAAYEAAVKWIESNGYILNK